MTTIGRIVNSEEKKQSSNELKQKLEDYKKHNESLEKIINHQETKELLIKQGVAEIAYNRAKQY